MIVKLIFRLIMGYLRIEVEGYYIERFINMCTNRKTLIWNLKRKERVKLYLNIGINDFKKLSKISHITHCKIRIIKKGGIPFFLNKYKKRKIFVILLLLIIIVIYISSKYIWNIEIQVKDNLEIENITEDLKEAGLLQGVLKSKIDVDKIINQIRLKRNDIAWIGIDMKGTNIIVNIVKTNESPKIIDKNEYCNIVAKKPGIVTKIIAQNGTKMVDINSEVESGQILIAGYMDGKYTDRRYVHSLGEIEAKVKYQESKKIQLQTDIYNETGNIEKKYEIDFNKFKLKLYKNNSKYELFRSEVEKKKFMIYRNFYLPISIVKITNFEQEKKQRNYSIEEAIEEGTKYLNEILEKRVNNKEKILDQKIETQEMGDSIMVTLTYYIIENIGCEQKIE